MSDAIKHECGIAFLRLKKPLQHYREKYGTSFYALGKMYLLMSKQVNRGQDGAGLANIKLNVAPGNRYISRKRSNAVNPIKDLFDHVSGRFKDLHEVEKNDPEWLKRHHGFTGEVFLGHLRYGTYGGNGIEQCHPFLRQNNWMSRNLVVAGNFNMTNVDELFDTLIELGQHPKEKADTVTVLEKIGHFLDVENQELFDYYKRQGYSNTQISEKIHQNLNVQRILERSAHSWDGGYAIGGMMGHGDAFVIRDPHGIRPAFYYEDDEVAVVASERPVIQTAFNLEADDVHELPPGHAFIVKADGRTSLEQIVKPGPKTACSFERIYFSRSNDKDIYRERMTLGANLVPLIMDAIDQDLDKAVFSFIPNTAETCFYGLIKEIENEHNRRKIAEIQAMGNTATAAQIEKLLTQRLRIEKVAIKDAKQRTFITQDADRDDMVASVYDITYGTVNPGVDTLVMIDDSIVRGTTLKKSILRILDRLGPKKIVIVSSAPQIRYPDCYGIDMARMGDFIAFQAAVALHEDRGTRGELDVIYKKCKDQEHAPKEQVKNYVQEVYAPFTTDEINAKISELLRPEGIQAEVQIIYQTLEGLHAACPENTGDWYFSGNYPTPGGNKVVNRAFVYYMEGRTERAY